MNRESEKAKKMPQPTIYKGSNYAACLACPGSQASIATAVILTPVCSVAAWAL